MSRFTGGPAFPTGTGWNHEGKWVGGGDDGMTLRDYFAAKAMQSMVVLDHMGASILAKQAYEVADAMLKERAL